MALAFADDPGLFQRPLERCYSGIWERDCWWHFLPQTARVAAATGIKCNVYGTNETFVVNCWL